MLRRILGLVVGVLTVGAVGGVVLRAVPDGGHDLVGMLVSMTPWYAVGSVLVLACALLLRRWWAVSILVVVVVIHGMWLAPFFGDATAADTAGRTPLRVMTLNAQYGGAHADEVVAEVRASRIEVLVVVELTSELVTALDQAGLDDLLPYQHLARVGSGTVYGGGIWSATELTDPADLPATSRGTPSANVTVGKAGAAGTAVRVTAVHTTPPLPGLGGLWGKDFAELTPAVRAQQGPQLIMGDFNATWDHSSFRTLVGDQLTDATRAAGRGPTPTWPSGPGPFSLISIDHILVTRTLLATDLGRVDIGGTDHKALVATVWLPAA